MVIHATHSFMKKELLVAYFRGCVRGYVFPHPPKFQSVPAKQNESDLLQRSQSVKTKFFR